MDRRSNTITGLVNFPVHDKRYKHTSEGGMFVRLVVVPNEKWDDWTCCCGGEFQIHADECFQDDDEGNGELFHFPDMDKDTDEPDENSEWSRERSGYLWTYLSIDYCSAVFLGSTGWSGFDEKTEEYWVCTYEDLNEEGKLLYDMLKKLHEGNARVLLQTWLDT